MNQEKDTSQKSKEVARQTARKMFVQDILQATYLKRSGWDPNAILTHMGEASRVHIMGIIVAVEADHYIVDDGTSSIMLRFFDEPKTRHKLGSLVSVIGKPREWQSSKYIVPEIIKQIDNKAWLSYHKTLVQLHKKSYSVALPVTTEQQQEVDIGPYQQILNTIAMLDKGSGASISDIIKALHLKDDTYIQSLLTEGEIFELSPGKVKVLE